jgi:hypothetical protein
VSKPHENRKSKERKWPNNSGWSYRTRELCKEVEDSKSYEHIANESTNEGEDQQQFKIKNQVSRSLSKSKVDSGLCKGRNIPSECQQTNGKSISSPVSESSIPSTESRVQSGQPQEPVVSDCKTNNLTDDL